MKTIDQITYVDKAENIIKDLKHKSQEKHQTPIDSNQIRNILSMMNELYEMVRMDRSNELGSEIVSHIQYVRMRLVYEAGRKTNVKILLENSQLLDCIKEIKCRDDLVLVCRYTEALVAYHKFYIGDRV